MNLIVLLFGETEFVNLGWGYLFFGGGCINHILVLIMKMYVYLDRFPIPAQLFNIILSPPHII